MVVDITTGVVTITGVVMAEGMADTVAITTMPIAQISRSGSGMVPRYTVRTTAWGMPTLRTGTEPTTLRSTGMAMAGAIAANFCHAGRPPDHSDLTSQLL